MYFRYLYMYTTEKIMSSKKIKINIFNQYFGLLIKVAAACYTTTSTVIAGLMCILQSSEWRCLKMSIMYYAFVRTDVAK